MSVMIRGMEMPTSCYDCNCFIRDSDGSDYCCLLMQDIEDNNKRDDGCPLVSVPPHGDLIDRDALEFNYIHITDDGTKIYTQRGIDAAPTVIEAEEN